MKRAKKLLALLTLLVMTFLLTGCLSINMNVKSNGSLEMTYTIDTSQTQGLLSFSDII